MLITVVCFYFEGDAPLIVCVAFFSCFTDTELVVSGYLGMENKKKYMQSWQIRSLNAGAISHYFTDI